MIDVHSRHSEHVRELALALFDCTRLYHGLGETQRQLLGQAALLYDLPSLTPKKKSLRGIHGWLQAHLEEELSQEELNVLAASLAFQSGKIKEQELAALSLPPPVQREARLLAALLRIAAGLDNSQSQQTNIQRVEPGPGGIWILVEGPGALGDAGAAQQKTRLWDESGYPKIKVREAEQAKKDLAKVVPLPGPIEKMGIEAGDDMAEAGRKVLRYHFAEMLRHEEGTRLGEDIEALHDMRVATRRMRAAFEVFGDAFEPEVIKPHLKGLRATGRALGRVRDLDVFMEKAQRYLDASPEVERDGLTPLLNAWKGQREAARAEMLDHLNSDGYHTFKWEFNAFLSTPGAGARRAVKTTPAPFIVYEVAPVLIYTRLAGVRAYGQILENASIEQHHALRIEFKKLRYTVEYFREALGDEAKMVIGDLKKIQDHLGDLNDADVATQILRNFLNEREVHQAGLPVSERQNLEAVVNYLAARHAERHQLLVSFPKVWQNFNRPGFRRNLALAVSVL